MKRILPFLGVLLISGPVICAPIDYDKLMPGRRKAASVPEFAETLFARGAATNPHGGVDDLRRNAASKLTKFVVCGLSWSENAAERAILIGDSVLHAGERVPPRLVSDGTIFQVRAIERSIIVVEGEIAGANPLAPNEVTKIAIEIPMSLRETTPGE